MIKAARVGEHSDVEWNCVYRSPFFAIRSNAGVATDAAECARRAEPASSVMMSSTLGAPLGGTMRGGHHGVDSEAFSLITPPNFGSGGGSCFPPMVVVAFGEPNSPVTCCAMQEEEGSAKATAAKSHRDNVLDYVHTGYLPFRLGFVGRKFAGNYGRAAPPLGCMTTTAMWAGKKQAQHLGSGVAHLVPPE